MTGHSQQETTYLMHHMVEAALAVHITPPHLTYKELCETVDWAALPGRTAEEIEKKFFYILAEETQFFPKIPVKDMLWVQHVFGKKTISFVYQKLMKKDPTVELLPWGNKGPQHVGILLNGGVRYFALRYNIPRDVEEDMETNWEGDDWKRLQRIGAFPDETTPLPSPVVSPVKVEPPRVRRRGRKFRRQAGAAPQKLRTTQAGPSTSSAGPARVRPSKVSKGQAPQRTSPRFNLKTEELE